MASIAFLHSASEPYSGETLRVRPLRGIESCTILLGEALAERGHDVAVYNGVVSSSDFNDVAYRPFTHAATSRADLWIANNNPRDFTDAAQGSAKRVVWMHNPTNLHRQWKKGYLGPMFRYRPQGVFLSQTHDAAVSRLIPFSDRRIIEHGSDPVFLGAEQESEARAPRAVFYSAFYRGVDWVLDVWREHIHETAPNAELHIIGELKDRRSDDFPSRRIVHHPPMPKADLAAFLRTCRVLLYQGHKDETYCNVVTEAYSSGLPIVTRGIGVLGERVEHEISGLIADSPQGFATAAARLLTDDKLWLSMHAHVLHHPCIQPWSKRAEEWEIAFL